jgi:hypothetical protein
MKRLICSVIFLMITLPVFAQGPQGFVGEWKSDPGTPTMTRKLALDGKVIVMTELQPGRNGGPELTIIRKYPTDGSEVTMDTGIWAGAKATGKMVGNVLTVDSTMANGRKFHDVWTLAEDGRHYINDMVIGDVPVYISFFFTKQDSTLPVLGANVMAQDSDKPRITPYFDRIDDGPAFFVECRNTGGEPVSSGADVWPDASSVRIDGATVPDDGVRIGPGLTTAVAPGQLWRGIIALRQSSNSFGPAVRWGALVRSSRVIPLGQGRHTIAVECAGVWSDDFKFYWESDTQPHGVGTSP